MPWQCTTLRCGGHGNAFMAVRCRAHTGKRRRLPAAWGGMGMRRAVEHCDAAYVASVSGSFQLCTTMDPAYAWEGTEPDSPFFAAASSLNVRLADKDHLAVATPAAFKQKSLSAALDKLKFEHLLRDYGELDRARLRAKSAPRASAWLDAVPNPELALHIDNNRFQLLVQWWFGGDVYPRDRICPRCRLGLDVQGQHAVQCMTRGERTIRHNNLRRVIEGILISLGIAATHEEPNLLPDAPRRRPGDLYVPYGITRHDGKDEAIDFA
eukprot:gene56735-biopygen110221